MLNLVVKCSKELNFFIYFYDKQSMMWL